MHRPARITPLEQTNNKNLKSLNTKKIIPCKIKKQVKQNNTNHS